MKCKTDCTHSIKKLSVGYIRADGVADVSMINTWRENICGTLNSYMSIRIILSSLIPHPYVYEQNRTNLQNEPFGLQSYQIKGRYVVYYQTLWYGHLRYSHGECDMSWVIKGNVGSTIFHHPAVSRGFDTRVNLARCVHLKPHCRSIWCTHETRKLHTNGRVPGGHLWHHRDDVYKPWLRTYTIVLRLLVSHLGAFPGYMQSMSEVCATVCGSMPFAHVDPVCRPKSRAAAAYICNSPVRRVSMLYQSENFQVTISHTHWRQ